MCCTAATAPSSSSLSRGLPCKTRSEMTAKTCQTISPLLCWRRPVCSSWWTRRWGNSFLNCLQRAAGLYGSFGFGGFGHFELNHVSHVCIFQLCFDTYYWTAVNQFFVWGSLAAYFAITFTMYSNGMFLIFTSAFPFVGEQDLLTFRARSLVPLAVLLFPLKLTNTDRLISVPLQNFVFFSETVRYSHGEVVYSPIPLS